VQWRATSLATIWRPRPSGSKRAGRARRGCASPRRLKMKRKSGRGCLQICQRETATRLSTSRSTTTLTTSFKDMLYGEAEAMAAYAADGRRIPRRGEIGLDSDRIEKYEEAGYVMSGSRHKRMTAVRLRKENQVINAEEKRAILKLQREEKMRKEGAIVSQFREMLDEKLREGKAET